MSQAAACSWALRACRKLALALRVFAWSRTLPFSALRKTAKTHVQWALRKTVGLERGGDFPLKKFDCAKKFDYILGYEQGTDYSADCQ
jgi:hypothetical protein